MEVTQETNDKPTFLSHVFSTSDEDKGEMLNVMQYALIGIIPVVILNKLVHRFIPEADPDKSSLELLVEIAIQIVIIFIGIILIHRMITFVPTYSGFKYETLSLTSVVLLFLVIVLSIQSKIGMKSNILVDRAYVLWNGPTEGMEDEAPKKKKSMHKPSQADMLDNPALQNDLYPPAPIAVNRPSNDSQRAPNMMNELSNYGPAAANGVLGGAFGSVF